MTSSIIMNEETSDGRRDGAASEYCINSVTWRHISLLPVLLLRVFHYLEMAITSNEQLYAAQRQISHTRVGCYAISATRMKDFQSPYPRDFFRFITHSLYRQR
jgi:hypothetical protein